uniref:Uncharacterized protein n=1 Tax=viral metagenome TaxID=1070528 RepID=A0A6C0EGG5_9ZZZZ
MTDTNNPFEGEQKMTSSNLEETLNSLTSYIRQLQGVEESMYKVLRNNPNITDLEKEEAVSQINDLSAKREALNHEINSLGERAKVDLKVDFQAFQQQMRIVEAAERQLNESKIKLKLLNDEKLNKLRLVQINTYYHKRYDALSSLVKKFVLFIAVAIIIAILMQRGLIPAGTGSIIMAVYFALGFVYFYIGYMDIAQRSKRNFDEYEWPFNRNMDSSELGEYDSSEECAYTGNNCEKAEECIGEECCTTGMSYDEMEGKCVPNDKCATEEGMTSALTQNMFNSRPEMVQVADNGPVKPFSNKFESFASF